MVGTLSFAGVVAVGLLAIVGTAYVFVGTDDVSGTETRLTDWSLVLAMALFVGTLLWTVWSLA